MQQVAKIDVQKHALYDLSDKNARSLVIISNDGSPVFSILPETNIE